MFQRKDKVAEESKAFVDDSEGNTGSTQSDSDEESLRPCSKCGHELTSDAAFCPKCGAKQEEKKSCCRCSGRCCCCCCLYFLITTALLIGLGVLLALSMNTWVKFGIEEVSGAVFGTDVRIGAMNLGLQHGRATITNMTVSSPPGYKGSFFTLGRFVFDLSPRSVLAAWLSKWTDPVELRQLSIRDIKVYIDINWTVTPDSPKTTSNAEDIVEHMNKAVKPLPTPAPEEVEEVGLTAMEAKVKVGLVELTNIDAAVTIHPFISTPVDWNIKEILVRDVGERSDGVYVWEFVEILSRAILMGVIKGAPDNIRANLAKIFGDKLASDLMDYKKIMYDTGKGLCKMSEFTGWATAEAALLPLKFTALQARITGKAIETQAKLGLKAAEAGVKLTGLGIRANLAATNAVVKAGFKANEEAMKIRNAFTFGWMKAAR